MSVDVTMTVKGPLLKGRAIPAVRNAMHNTVETLVQMGEQRLDQTLRPRPAGVYLSFSEARKGQASTGHYRRNISGTTKELSGRIDDGGVVYGPWLEGVSSRNQRTRFKGYASFRRTAQWLQKQVKGVLRGQVNRLIRELGG